MRQNLTHLAALDQIPVTPGAEENPTGDAPLHSRLAFVQVGLWEVRRRWLTGQTTDLDRLLACLDEDVEALKQAISEDVPAEDAVPVS